MMKIIRNNCIINTLLLLITITIVTTTAITATTESYSKLRTTRSSTLQQQQPKIRSIQETTTTLGSSTTQLIECMAGYRLNIDQTTCISSCANPYGNPCGPFSACTDSDNGIVCSKDQYIQRFGCEANGCDAHSSCQLVQEQEDEQGQVVDTSSSDSQYSCVCNEGYERKVSYLPCVPIGANINLR